MTQLPGAHLWQFLQDTLTVRPFLQEVKPTLRIGMLDFSEERLQALKLLDSLQVPVVAWLLLPADDGQQIDWRSASEAENRYEALQAWSKEHDLTWAGIALAVMPDKEEQEWLEAKRSRYASRMLQRMYNAGAVEEAAAKFQNLIHQMQADGYLVECHMPTYHFDAKEVASDAPEWLTGIPMLDADRYMPIVFLEGQEAEAEVRAYAASGQGLVLGMQGGTFGNSAPAVVEWSAFERAMRLGNGAEELLIFSLEGCHKKGFLAKFAALPEQETLAVVSQDALQKRERMQRLMRYLAYPKALLVMGTALFLLAIWAFVSILRRALA